MQSSMRHVSSHLDFSHRVDAEGQDKIAITATAFNRLLDTLQGSLGNMRQNAERVGHASTHLAAASQQVFNGSNEQSDASSSMAAAVEQLTVSINHVSDRAGDANQMVIEAGQIAHDGASTISKTLADIRQIETAIKQAAETVTRLDERSAKVSNVVIVIKEVAEQTNLLALNAAIEAARAGEQGRGFTVVADEVRRLAERTAQSTQEISSTMVEMQNDAHHAVSNMLAAVSQVENSVQHAMDAETAVQEIESGARQTVAIVGEIADAISEQSAASSIIAQQVERIAQMSEENSAAARNTAETSSTLNQVAKEMCTEIERYRV
jgi:methyl-accepting chemotaxis protein